MLPKKPGSSILIRKDIEIIYLNQPKISFKIDIEGDGLSSMLIAKIGELIIGSRLDDIIKILTRKITDKFPNLIRQSKTSLAPEVPLLSRPEKSIGLKIYRRIESVGLSITWPYWFGRYLGVFSADD